MHDALHIRGLEKMWPNGKFALSGVDLTVEDGDFYALLGPNGAGKSTAIGIVSSLVNKSAGQVSVFGDDLDSSPAAVRRHIGLVPQEFNMNLWEPVLDVLVNQAGFYGVPRRQANARAESCLELLGLHDRRHSVVRELSGGMRRRLMIARALVHQPRLLILDEPTAGVDIEIRRATWSLLKALNAQGTAILLTTHYLEEAEALCRTVGIIDEGKLLEQGPVERMLDQASIQTFVFDLREPLHRAPEIEAFSCNIADVDGYKLEVSVATTMTLNAVFTVLERAGIQVVSMRNKHNRLEEFFLRRVGRDLAHD